MNIKDNEKLKMVVGSSPHPIINSIIGNNLSFSKGAVFDINTTARDYTVGVNYTGNLRAYSTTPEAVPHTTRWDNKDEYSYAYTDISIEDIVNEQNNFTEKEYRYTVDLGAEMTNAVSDTFQEAIFFKTAQNSLLDFVEYKYKIPLFINKNECEFLKTDILTNNDSMKLFGIDIEFDTVVPEALFKELDKLMNAYLYTNSLTALHWVRTLPSSLQKSYLHPSHFLDEADKTPQEYNLLNGLSGRHCKYELTVVKDSERNMVFTHNDMIYDSLCHSNVSIHRMLSYNMWNNMMCGGVLREKVACVNPGNFNKSENVPVRTNYIYPLPLNVSFEFDTTTDRNIESDIISGSSYQKIGNLVIRTYKGVRHFVPTGWRKLRPITKNDTSRSLINCDLYVDFLRAFTFKISIPRNIPSLVIVKNGETHYAEVYGIPTTWQNSSEKIKTLDFTDRTKNMLEWSIRPNTFVSAEYIHHVDESLSPITDKAFINHINELGGFNGFLLPPERRVVDYPLRSNTIDYRFYYYENVDFKIDY